LQKFKLSRGEDIFLYFVGGRSSLILFLTDGDNFLFWLVLFPTISQPYQKITSFTIDYSQGVPAPADALKK